jgi:hypothetical protein
MVKNIFPSNAIPFISPYRFIWTSFIVAILAFSGCKSNHAKKQIAILDDSTVARLCNRVTTNPVQLDVDSLVSQLDISLARSSSKILETLADLFVDSTRTDLILHSLVTYTVPNFDYELSKFPYTLQELDKPRAQLWLGAIKHSGTNRCFDSLSRLATNPTHLTNKNQAKLRGGLFLTLSEINYTNACKLALVFYVRSGESELELVPADQNAITKLITNLPDLRSGFCELYEYLNFFIPNRTIQYADTLDTTPYDTYLAQLQRHFNTHPALRKTVKTVVEAISKINAPIAARFIESVQGIPFYDSLSSAYLPKFKFPKTYSPEQDIYYLSFLSRNNFNRRQLKSIDLDYHAVCYKFISDICRRYNFDSLSKQRVEFVIDSFSAAFPGLDTAMNMTPTKYLGVLLSTLLTPILKAHSQEDVIPLANAITQKELDNLTLALYAIGKRRSEISIRQKFTLDQYEAELHRLSSVPVKKDEVVSAFKDNVLPLEGIALTRKDSIDVYTSVRNELNQAGSKNLGDSLLLVQRLMQEKQLANLGRTINEGSEIQDKTPSAFTLVSRGFSLAQGLYKEELEIKYQGGGRSHVFWYGLIPQKYLQSLIRCPRILDLAEISLAKEEWKNGLWRNYNFKTEPEVVMMNQLVSLPMLYYQLRNDSIPFPFVVDEIRIANAVHPRYEDLYQTDYEYFGRQKASSVSSMALELIKASAIAPIQPLRPKSLVSFKPWYKQLDPSTRWFLDSGFPLMVNGFFGNHFCQRQSEFDSMRNWLRAPLTYIAGYKITDRAYGPIRVYIDENMPDFVGNVPVLSWLAPRIFGNYNKAKGTNLSICDQTIANARASADFMSDWDFLTMPIDQSTQVVMRQTIIDSSFEHFLATYQLNFPNGQVKFVSLEGDFDKMGPEVKEYIKHNQQLVQVANLDLTCSTIAASDYFNRIAQAFNQDSYGQFSTEYLLKSAGYLWQLPIAYPNTPYHLLYGSSDGDILASEIKTYLKIWDIGRFGSNIYDYTPTADFISCLRGLQQSVNQSIAQYGDQMAAAQIADIKKQQDDQKVYSFSYTSGGEGTVFSANYSNGNINIGLGLFSNNGTLTGFGTLGGITVLSFNLSNKPDWGATGNGYNSIAVADSKVQMGMSSPLNNVSTNSERMNRVPASSNAAVQYWTRTADGSLEYRGPVVIINDYGNNTASGPFEIQQDIMAKNDIKGKEIIYLLEYVSSKISREQKQVYLNALLNHTFSPQQYDELVTLRQKVREQTMIEDGTWAETEIVKSLIPDKTNPGQMENIDDYLNDINQGEAADFFKEVTKKQQALKTQNVIDKRQKWKITYDKDFEFIRLEQYFVFPDGDVVKFGFTQHIPYFLNRELLKQNPNGHIYEKLMNTLVDSKFSYGRRNAIGLNAGDKVTIDKILKEFLKPSANELKTWSDEKRKYIESLTVKDTLTRIMDNYFKRLDAWLSDPANQGKYVTAPFPVSPLEFPFLYFYPYSDDHLQKLELLKTQLLVTQKSSTYYSTLLQQKCNWTLY